MQKKGSSCDFKKSLRAHWFFSLRAKPITSSVFQLSGATSSFRTRHNEKMQDLSSFINTMRQFMRFWYLSHRGPAKAQATSEGSSEPAHRGSLTRVFAVPTHEVWK